MELAKITPRTVRRENGKELLNLHRHLHGLYAQGEADRDLLEEKHGIVVGAMRKRGLIHNVGDELDERATPMRGLYLTEPHGELIWRGKKRAMAKSRHFDLEGETFGLCSDGDEARAYGYVRFHAPEKVPVGEFDEPRWFKRHRITPRERQRWWPKAEHLWVYEVAEFQKFEEPETVEVPHGVQTFIRDFHMVRSKALDTRALLERLKAERPGDTVLVPDFLWLVGGAVEHPAKAADIDVLFRADEDGGQFAIDALSATTAVRDVIAPGKGAKLDYWWHAQGPHQGKALPLADLVLRWKEPEEREIKAASLKLDLGCGENKPDGYVGLDKRSASGVDRVHDLTGGIPYPDGSAAEVRAWHFLEDLKAEERVPLMREVWRVLEPGGKFVFEVPHAESAGAEMPFHLSHWTTETFKAFAVPELVEAYDLPPFEVVSLETVEDGGAKNVRGVMTPAKDAKTAEIKPVVRKPAMPKPRAKYYTDTFSPEELHEKWAEGRYPVMAEQKYNGFRCCVQKSGGRVSVFFEDSQEERSGQLPDLVAKLKKVNHDFILDCNVGVSEGGRPWPRIKLMTLTADEPKLDGGQVVLTAFDVIYWDGDVHGQSFGERRKLLEGAVRKAGLEISEGAVVKNLAGLKRAFAKYGKAPGSEGLVAKTLDASYPWGEAATSEWSKVKLACELKALVLETKRTKTGLHNFRGGLLLGDADYANTVERDGKKYVDLKWSFNAKFSAREGDVVTFEVEEVILRADGGLAWLGAKPLDVDKARKQPYYAAQAVDLARRARVLQDARKTGRKAKLEEESSEPRGPRAGASAKFWAENWWKMFPRSGRGQFTYQHHFRGLSEEESKLDEPALLETDHSVHGDLRLTARTGDLWGFSVFLGKTADVRKAGGCRLCDLPPDDNLQGSFKLEEPKEWLDVARRKPYVSEPEEAGATTKKYAKFFEVAHGSYRVGVWREHLFELFLDGGKLSGRYLIEYAPIGGRRIWIVDRPKDQTPYAEKHKLEDVLAELKKKKQAHLVWSDGRSKPVLYDTATGELVKRKADKSLEDYGGNILTDYERRERLAALEQEITEGKIDKNLIPYLERINSHPFLVTTQSCTGHGPDDRKPYIDFRSGLSETDTINRIIRPLQEKYPENLGIQVFTEADRLRYCIWFDDNLWEEQIKALVRILDIAAESVGAKATKAIVTVLERVEVEPGIYRHVVGLPFGAGAKAKRGEGGGRWVTIQGRPVYITDPRGGPGQAGSGRSVRVGITSFKDDKGQTAKQLEKDMDELKSALEDTPARDVTVALGTGGFEGGSEPTFVTQFRGDGEARKALARKAKEWNQDSVIVTTPVKEGGTPEGRLSFSRPLDAAEIEKVNQTILASSDKLGAGIGGWTWAQGKDGPEFIANCIPEWGGNPDAHIQAMRAAKEILKKSGLGSTLAEGRAEVEIWERDKGDYDRIIEG